MPQAELPTNLKGWAVAIGSGVIGFLAGFLFILLMNKTVG